MSATLLSITNEVLRTLQGYGLVTDRAAFLSGSLNSSALTFTVDDASDIQAGIAEIDSELVYIKSVDRDTKIVTLSADGRGYAGSTAASHSSGARVTIAPTWPRVDIKQAVNDTITGCYPTLFGVAQTQFTYNPSVTTYALPSSTDGVLKVTADTLGPSLEQVEIHHYDVNGVAPTDDWATAKTITLHRVPAPGVTVTVTYRKIPTTLSADADLLTASGLRESARLAVVYGALSQLTASMDAARLPVNTAEGSGYDETNPIGQASRISGQLYLRYQNELEAERKRLRSTTPVVLRVRKR